MANVVGMPSVMAGSTEAVINKWLAKVGDAISVGQPLVEIETEKANVEYSSEVAGVLGKLLVSEGQTVSIGEPICLIGQANESFDSVEVMPEANSATETIEPEQLQPLPASTILEGSVSSDRVFASPLARRLAKERNLEIAALVGTGPQGRILRADVDKALRPLPPLAQVAEPSPKLAENSGESVPLTPLRKAIARRLTQSKQEVPHFYLKATCNVDRLMLLRQEINQNLESKVSVNDFIIRASALALMKVPEANVIWAEDHIFRPASVDISIAVSSEHGLVTPVLRNLEGKSLLEISAQSKDFAERARRKALQQREIEGGSFSISNLGMFGTEEFSAIINPPQSAILAVGAAKPSPVVIDGQIGLANLLTVVLSADHRVVDGALAAQWLKEFKDLLENPVRLLL
jgi:pyruvate dehydrogenase E2 component (dihydrolipoamide acetyltransferase)